MPKTLRVLPGDTDNHDDEAKTNAKQTKPSRKRRNPAPPTPSEKARKLTLKAFRMTYEAHHGKDS